MERLRVHMGGLLALVIALCIAFVFASSASGQRIEPTVLPQSSPLQITGYRQDLPTKSLDTIQLYNSTGELVDLTNWNIEITDESGRTKTAIMQISKRWMTADSHIVIASLSSTIENPTVSLLGWSENSAFGVVKKISLVSSEPTVRPHVISFDSKDTGNSKLRLRNFGVSSYLSTFADSEPASIVFGDYLYEPAESAELLQIVEIYPYSSSCSPADDSVLCADYVKLHNPTTMPIELSKFALRSDSGSLSRTKSNTIHMDGILEPGSYSTISLTDEGEPLSLTNSGGFVWVEDTWGLSRYDETITEYESAGISQQGYSWAQDVDGLWRWSAKPNPFGENTFPPEIILNNEPLLADCPEGKYRNPETNRCRTIEEAVNALAICPEGQSRNPETNRCRSNVLGVSSALTPCKEGQERNPVTNRCRNISSALAELLPCDEGSERNPLTNRCRKVSANSPLANPASIAPLGSNGSSAVVQNTLLGAIAICAFGYGIYEWRSELGRFVKRLINVIVRK